VPEARQGLGLDRRELHPVDPQQDQDQVVAVGMAPQGLGPGAEAGEDLIGPGVAVARQPVPAPLRRAAEHLDVCPECAEEFRALLAALAEEGGSG
jgi:hypothetical protein